jgi:hypothetical protein
LHMHNNKHPIYSNCKLFVPIVIYYYLKQYSYLSYVTPMTVSRQLSVHLVVSGNCLAGIYVTIMCVCLDAIRCNDVSKHLIKHNECQKRGPKVDCGVFILSLVCVWTKKSGDCFKFVTIVTLLARKLETMTYSRDRCIDYFEIIVFLLFRQ